MPEMYRNLTNIIMKDFYGPKIADVVSLRADEFQQLLRHYEKTLLNSLPDLWVYITVHLFSFSDAITVLVPI